MSRKGAVACQVEGCGMTWPRDPVMTVACPTCGAAPGRACKQPSGHGTWNAFGRFHPERDLHADRSGAYGPPDHCPLGRCGHANVAARQEGIIPFQDGVIGLLV